jgi:hypothetical protein
LIIARRVVSIVKAGVGRNVPNLLFSKNFS